MKIEVSLAMGLGRTEVGFIVAIKVRLPVLVIEETLRASSTFAILRTTQSDNCIRREWWLPVNGIAGRIGWLAIQVSISAQLIVHIVQRKAHFSENKKVEANNLIVIISDINKIATIEQA